MKLKSNASLVVAKLCCRALDEKKAGDLKLLDVSEQSSITNFLVLATATSEPHLRALRVELEKALDAAKVHIVGMEAEAGSGWIVVDAFDVMVHLFSADRRSQYGLENLWKDAVPVSVGKLLAQPAKKPAARPVKRPRK
ncbi:MAG: ribosome silencing factor [Opitutaceae bacterium]